MNYYKAAQKLRPLTTLNRYGLFIHEYQAYDILKKYQLPVVQSYRVSTPEDAYTMAQRILASATRNKPIVDIMVKAQVHARGRSQGSFKQSGLKGGIQVASKASQVLELSQKMLGNNLVTCQTGAVGRKCNDVLIVEKISLRKQFYISFSLDHESQQMMVTASPKGGMNIDEVQPHKVYKFTFPPAEAVPVQIISKIIACFRLPHELISSMKQIIQKLFECFVENDATELQINPLGIDIEGNIKICDSKIVIDDNAAFRQEGIFMCEDLSQKNWKEVLAEKYNFNYVALDGNIGCIVNGAGLAMATMDLVQMKGGRPANFLDVGGRTTAEQVVAAINIMDRDTNVEAVFANIFSGSVRADVIVFGLIKGINAIGMKKPIALRINGIGAEEAKVLVEDSGFNMVLTEDFDDATTKSIKMADILKMAKQAKLNVFLL